VAKKKSKIDADDERLRQLLELDEAIEAIKEVISAARVGDGRNDGGEPNPGLVLKATAQLKELLERHAELCGLDAPPHMQKVELSGTLGHLLKLSQTPDADESTGEPEEDNGSTGP
jgi:hypothetical protein